MLICAELFANHLKSKDLYFDTDDKGEKVIIKVPSGGKTATCVFTGDDGEYLSIYLYYDGVSEDQYASVLIACNDLNAEYKWVKFYLDSDNDLMLEEDAILSISSAENEAFELLVRLFKILDEAKPVIQEAMN